MTDTLHTLTATQTPHDAALAAGYTREVYGEAMHHTIIVLVKPDTCLDDRFRAWDTEGLRWINVNGWLFAFNDA
jgi:hypothetical protein